MSVMANTTPIVTTITKPATKEKTPRDTDASPRVDIHDFCEEDYEDILPVIDRILCDKQKEVHTRLNFGENPRKSRRIREGSQNSSAGTLIGTTHRHRSRDRDRSRYEKRRESESLLSRVSESNTSDGGHWKSKSKRHKPMDEDDLAGSTGSRKNFPCGSTTGTLANAYVVSYVQFYPNRGRKTREVCQDPVEIHNIKQRDGETIKHFMERFKVETRRMKGAPECMRIFGFMHAVNNPELTKRLNEHVPKTMEEMMIATTAFIQGETATLSKKKGHAS
ncbi:hypothetical protein Tco_0322164 [Tanacetum coccineum]